MLLQAFWLDVEDQVPNCKVELIIVAKKRLLNDMDRMQDKREYNVP